VPGRRLTGVVEVMVVVLLGVGQRMERRERGRSAGLLQGCCCVRAWR
jgi:hypothetical protein